MDGISKKVGLLRRSRNYADSTILMIILWNPCQESGSLPSFLKIGQRDTPLAVPKIGYTITSRLTDKGLYLIIANRDSRGKLALKLAKVNRKSRIYKGIGNHG